MNGAPAKPISGVVAQLGEQQRDRLGDRGDLLGVQHAAAGARRPSVRTGSASTGPVPGTMSTPDAGRVQRHHDVAEQDGRVHPVPAHRLQGDLAGQLRGQAGLQHAGVGAQRAVLRQRAAGLAHEPDRQPGRGAAARGDQQRGGVERPPARRSRSDRVHGVMTELSVPRPVRSIRGRPARLAALTTRGDDLESSLVPDATAPPPQFQQAVASLRAVRPRPELLFSTLDAPPRLAPYTWAFALEADAGRPGEDLDEPDTSGRLILLHDPDGQAVWEGTFRLVCFVQARLERDQLGDDLLPVVGWSWLTESLRRPAGRLCRPRRHRHPDLLGAVRGHRRSPPGRRRRAARVVDAGRHRSDPARRGVLRLGRVGRRTAPGRRTSSRPSELISVSHLRFRRSL